MRHNMQGPDAECEQPWNSLSFLLLHLFLFECSHTLTRIKAAAGCDPQYFNTILMTPISVSSSICPPLLLPSFPSELKLQPCHSSLLFPPRFMLAAHLRILPWTPSWCFPPRCASFWAPCEAHAQQHNCCELSEDTVLYMCACVCACVTEEETFLSVFVGVLSVECVKVWQVAGSCSN